MRLRPLSSALGAEVLGFDLNRDLSQADFAAVHGALLDHLVLVFKDQDLSPARQVAFSRLFGPLDQHPADDAVLPGQPEVLLVSTRRKNGEFIGLPDAGPMWHSDLAYRKQTSLGSMLFALEVPDRGGDTGFANMYAAYDALSAALKGALEGRRAVFLAGRNNSNRRFRRGLSQGQRDSTPAVSHPAIRTHPETGRKAIFVNPQHTIAIEGMDEAESQDVLAQIFAHTARVEFSYFHRWTVGDLVFWDNRCVQHIADLSRLDDPGYVRHLHRTSIRGDVPF